MKWYFAAPLIVLLGLLYWTFLGAYRLLPVAPGFGFEAGDFAALAAWFCACGAGAILHAWR